jgi:preprotein translocase subunit SecB
MSETQPQQLPPLVVITQYIKDLSFEVPGAPAIYAQLAGRSPAISVNVDVQARRVTDGANTFEVVLYLRTEASMSPGAPTGTPPGAPTGTPPGAPIGANGGAAAVAPTTVFVAELAYGGMFALNNVPESSVEPVLLVECPRILFPFARNIVADVTRDGGFPPLMLQPFDFVALWQSRRKQPSAVAGAPPGAAIPN